jgi:hypothetical protein
MKNQGYYSWIHTLKSAAMDARQKGIEMINEQKAQRASGAAREKMEAQLNAPPPPPPTRNLGVAGKGYGGRDEEIIDVPGIGRYPKSRIEGEMAIEINRAMGAGEPDFEKPSVLGVNLASGDPGAFARLTRMKRAEVRAQVAQARGPVDAKPAGDANAVVRDGSDNVMADPADPEDGNEFITRLPKFSLAALARAEAGNAQPGDVELAKNAKPPLMSVENELKLHQDEREAAWEAEQEDRLLTDYSGRTGEVRMESKYVNQLITNLLNEEDEDSIRKQTDTQPIRGGKPGIGTENIFSTDKLNFKQLVDIYKNPHKYPPNFVAGVRAAFQDVFGVD